MVVRPSAPSESLPVGGRVDPPGSVGGIVDGRDGVPMMASQSIVQSSPPRAKVVVKMQPTQALYSSSHCPSVQEPHCSASCVEINQ